MKRLDLPRLLGMLAIAILAGVFWHHAYFVPVKVFVVFLHEASHALVALATGGQVVGMQVLLEESGQVLSNGGSPFWTLTAGYLGSLLWGGLILVVASRTNLAKALSVLLGSGMILLSILYMRNIEGFGFSLAFGGAMILAGLALPPVLAEWALRGLGLTSCLYAVFDVLTDVILRPELPSDARMLAERMYFTPLVPTTAQTVIWGILWMGIALLGTFFFLGLSMRVSKRREKERFVREPKMA